MEASGQSEMHTSGSPERLLPATSPISSSSSTKTRPYDLQMDLMLLRQMRMQDNAFQRGDPGYDAVASGLSSMCPEQFHGLTKKSVRDRVL